MRIQNPEVDVEFFDEFVKYETSHPTVPDALLNYDTYNPDLTLRRIRYPDIPRDFSEPDCFPHPFDVLAVYSWGKTGPTWSPNGEMLGYVLRIDNRVRNAQGGLETLRREVLYVVNADGSETRELFAVEDSLKESIIPEPAWSPDSQRIAFVHQTQPTEGNRGMGKLYTVRPDGSELTQILGPDDGLGPFGRFVLEIFVLSWSPDGTGVLIPADISYGHLSVVDPDGSNRRRVGASGAVGVWSPDGSRIAQYRDADSRIYLSTVNPDGSDLRVLLWIDEEGNIKRAD